MSNKGVSTIIATILILMIAIGLAGTAYVYFSGMVSGKTQKTISILEADCNGTHITLAVSNDGTIDIADSDITVLIDNVDRSDNYNFGSSLLPHNAVTVVPTGYDGETSGEHTLLIVSPSNSVRQSVYC